jgi:hypothetical protein
MSIQSQIATSASVDDSGQERRSEPRVSVEARLKCLNPSTTTSPSFETRVIEISRSGMRLRVNRELHQGEAVQVIVRDTVYVGVVRHSHRSEHGFEIGIQVTEDPSSSLS